MLIEVDTEQLLTPDETAAMLKISAATLAYWRRPKINSELPWIEVGGQVRYRLSDLKKWLEGRTRNGQA